MRVITGSARGMSLRTLEGETTRPTSEKVKEAVFSAIQFEIEGARVLDLFAGSGQLGIESLSRGAKSTVFVDSDKNAVKIIQANIERLEHIIEKAMELGQYKIAREAIDSLNKMLGLNNGLQIGVQTDNDNNTQQIFIKFDQ